MSHFAGQILAWEADRHERQDQLFWNLLVRFRQRPQLRDVDWGQDTTIAAGKGERSL
jgi:hypothetical protein